jgi:hypothetical protein
MLNSVLCVCLWKFDCATLICLSNYELLPVACTKAELFARIAALTILATDIRNAIDFASLAERVGHLLQMNAIRLTMERCRLKLLPFDVTASSALVNPICTNWLLIWKRVLCVRASHDNIGVDGRASPSAAGFYPN